MNQIHEYRGVVEIQGGWGDEALVDRDKLIEMLQTVPKGDIRISTVPHDHGRALIAKPRDSVSTVWYVLAPVKARKPRVPGEDL